MDDQSSEMNLNGIALDADHGNSSNLVDHFDMSIASNNASYSTQMCMNKTSSSCYSILNLKYPFNIEG